MLDCACLSTLWTAQPVHQSTIARLSILTQNPVFEAHRQNLPCIEPSLVPCPDPDAICPTIHSDRNNLCVIAFSESSPHQAGPPRRGGRCLYRLLSTLSVSTSVDPWFLSASKWPNTDHQNPQHFKGLQSNSKEKESGMMGLPACVGSIKLPRRQKTGRINPNQNIGFQAFS